jgi:hypothetical protein
MGRPSAGEIKGSMDKAQMRQRLRKISKQKLAGNVVFLRQQSDVIRRCDDALENRRSFVFASLQDETVG